MVRSDHWRLASARSAPTDRDLAKAHLNLHAVLPCLETLVRSDPAAATLVEGQRLSIEFRVRGGPGASVVFSNGVCRHYGSAAPGVPLERPRLRLYFKSPPHLNRVFDDDGRPLPVGGFRCLGFLQREFAQLAALLNRHLRPDPHAVLAGPELDTSTTLVLQTAVYGVRELVETDPVAQSLAAHTPPGSLQFEVLPDGPFAYLVFTREGVTAGLGTLNRPTARLQFRTAAVAHALLNNQRDSYEAIGAGDAVLDGLLPIIDNATLIMDRVALYLR